MEDRFQGKRVLVTGGAGFVGSNLVRKLVLEGASTVVLDDLTTGSLDNLAGLEGQYEMLVGSVEDRDLVMKTVSGVQLVFHLAARNIIASTRNPYDDFRTNIGGTLNVLLAAREHGIERVVYTSSASVYGNTRYLPINEDDRISILTPYSASKYSGEAYCQAFYESYDVSAVILRYSNVYGIGQDPQNPYCGVVSRFFQKVRADQPPEIHGDGQQTRDYTYVGDAVEATLSSALSSRAPGEVFNVATGIETDANTLARWTLDISGSPLKPVHIERRDIDNIRRRVLNVEKARRMLRWTPTTVLRDGLEITWKWFVGS